MARRELPVGRPDLPARQSAAARAARARARQAAAARPLRHDTRAQPALRAPEPRDPGARPECDLHRRARPRRPGAGRERLPRGHVQRGLPARQPRRGRPAGALPPVLVPGRDPEPRRARDARLDPRGRRARLLAGARLRRGVRQPRPARRLRRRRRRGRDRPARDELALEQVPERAHRRRRAADPAPERLQDREPDRARAHPRGRARRALRGLRLAPADRVRRRACRGAPGARGRARRGARRDRGDPARRPRGRRRARHVADDRPAHAEGLDRAEGGRRPAGRGHVALAPGAARGRSRQPGAPSASSRSGCAATGRRSSSTSDGALVPELRRARADRRAAHEREPARERRPAAPRPRPARLPATTPSTSSSRRRRRARRRACSAASSAT